MGEKKNRVWILLLLLVLIIILVLLGLKACGKSDEDSGSKVGSEVPNTGDFTKDFYGQTQKHGMVEFSSRKADTEYHDPQKFEYWFDGDRYRITWYYDDGTVRLHMISPDGEKLYHCSPEKKTCTISYVGPNFHQWIFNGPEGYKPGDGAPEGEFMVYTYNTEKLWEIEGASQKFYCEDVTIYTKDGVIDRIVTRTNSDKVAEEELVYSQYVILEQDNAVEYEDSLFELPYDIEKP